MITVQEVVPSVAKNICFDITATLPEWFGQPDANQRYAEGVARRVALCCFSASQPVGLISLEFQYPANGNIYWMGVARHAHHQGIGSALMNAAKTYCIQQGCRFITVETLSEKNCDETYLHTYHFYKKHGFIPLFEMHTHGPDFLMVYMLKELADDKL